MTKYHYLLILLLVFVYWQFRVNMSSDTEVIIIGSGLAGLTTAISLAESQKVKKIHLFEKAPVMGFASNSNKASSGMNGVNTKAQEVLNIKDSKELFMADTFKSGKNVNDKQLVNELAEHSSDAVDWIDSHSTEKMSRVAKLGGHSERRTHRFEKGAVGYSIIKSLTEKVQTKFKDTIDVHLNSKATRLIVEDEAVKGIEFVSGSETIPIKVKASTVVIATGGFSQNKDMLKQYGGVGLSEIPSSNGAQTTGDGITLIKDLNVDLVNMEYIQVHPTGFVDPTDKASTQKILAGEVLRGIGGLLFNFEGKRFVNELDTRDNVSAKIFLEQKRYPGQKIHIVIPSETAEHEIPTHLQFYSFKKLLTKTTLSQVFGSNLSNVSKEFTIINDLKPGMSDSFGRNDFFNQNYSDLREFYVGEVTPVVHFCMGGIKISINGEVLKKSGTPVRGLFAAGEVTGGVHGANRLGGSSLLECVVFGRKIAKTIISKL